jgi:hypothetical protein
MSHLDDSTNLQRLCQRQCTLTLQSAVDHGFPKILYHTVIHLTTMTLQRSAFRPPRPALPKTIQFVLPGRRTLSEHLPSEVIDLPIAVAQRSRYLRKMLVQQSITARQIRLPDVDSVGFRMYTEWLRTGHVEFQALARSYTSGALLLRDSFDLIFAHIAGSQLDEPDFQDYIIDTMERLLDSSHTPDLKVLEVVFLEKGACNALKQFVVDKMFAVERKMLGMMRGLVDDVESRERIEVGCKYHVHEKGECYRTRLKDRFVTGANGSDMSEEDIDLRFSSNNPRPQAIGNETMSNTAYGQYFGSVKCQPEVYGLEQRVATPDMYKHKPLPNIPPLVPGPLSPQSPLRSDNSSPVLSDCNDKITSTQQLVDECLRRLLSGNALRMSSHAQGMNQDTIPTLVLECLQRFKKTVSVSASSHTACSPELSFSTADLRKDVPDLVRKQNDSLPPNGDMLGLRNVHWERSFEELPKPWLKIPELTQDVGPEIANSSVPQVPLPVTTSAVKRKAAPPRGIDWLKQYDRVNSIMQNTPIIAKRSKKSRFKELLSENRFRTEGRSR